jgi:hypothetical protein
MKTISPSVAAPYLPKTRFKPFWRWYQFCENGLASAPPFLLRPPLQNGRSLPNRYPDPRPMLDGVGKDFLRLA